MADPNPATKRVKKPPTPVLIGAGLVGILLILYIKSHKKEPTENNATPGADQGLTSQAFIPVTGENVGGVGASGGGFSSGGGGGEDLASVLNFEKESLVEGRAFQESQMTALREYLASQQQGNHELLTTIVGSQTGGGAPESHPINTAPTPAPPVKTPPGNPSVPVKTIKCPNGCSGHEYPKGKNGKGSRVVECQQGSSKAKNCHW